MFKDLYRIYSNIDSEELGNKQLRELSESLKSVNPEEIKCNSEAKAYIELLRKFREAVAENDKLHGENYPDLLSSLLSVGENGLYSNNLRFIFELIQNVDDCDFANPQDCRLDIRFDFNNGQIVLTYNEVGFTPFNVFAITGIAEAAKNISSGKSEIGEKGIGFKSVFGVADRVWIKSGWFSFELHKNNFTIPIEKYESFQYHPGTQMTLNVGEKSREIYDQIKNQYCKKDAIFCRNPILFLNKLTSLRMYYDAWRSMEFKVSRHPDITQTGIQREDNIIISVDLHDHDQTKDLNVDKKEIICTRYSYPVVYSYEACQSRYGNDTQIGKDGGKTMLLQVIIPKPEYVDDVGNGALYSFLPTQIKLSVPFVCHVPFKLDASREFVDPQGYNEWFTDSVGFLSGLIKHVYLDWCHTIKEDIVYYLPAKHRSLFAENNGKERCLSNRNTFMGEYYLQLPLFCTVDNTFRSADEIFVFNHDENIVDPIQVYNLLKPHKSLFQTRNMNGVKRLGIETMQNVNANLFMKALSVPEITASALDLLSQAGFKDIARSLSGNDAINLTREQLELIFRYKEFSEVFVRIATSRIRENMRPVFQVRGNDFVNLQEVFSDEFVVEDTPATVKNYLIYCSGKCVCMDIGNSNYLPCHNGIILSNSDPLTSMAAFCYSMDPQDTFSVRVKLREASDRLNRITDDNSGTADDYLRELRIIRRLVKESLGTRGYTNYINLILRSGTDKNRFIQELIQNADDCKYPEGSVPTFSLTHHGNTIVTEYNEIGFTRDNIRSITAIGESTKNNLINGETETIGKKGVGFKTIFAIASEVKILSGEYQFFLTDKEPTIPKSIGSKTTPVNGTRMKVTLKGRDVLSVTDSKELLKLCLCLRKLKKLDIGDHSITIKDTTESRYITIDKRTHVFRKFIHEFKVDDLIVKEQDQFGYRTYSTQQKIVCYIPDKKESIDYFIYNGLPTRHKLFIPIAIDAPFELTTSREEIEIDRAEWNDIIRLEFYKAISDCMIKLRGKDRINILRFTRFLMRRYGNTSVYVNAISDSEYITSFDYKGFLKSLNILPTFNTNVFAAPCENEAFRYPQIARFIISNGDYGRVNTGTVIDEEESEYEAALNALECSYAKFEDTFALVEEYAETYIDNSDFRELLYSFLQEATGDYYERIAALAILPVYGSRRGVTEYLCYEDIEGELFVKKGTTVSADNYYVLNESILPKAICERILGININEMNAEYERALYKEKLEYAIKHNDIVEVYHFLLSELRNENISKYRAVDVLRANLDIIPLKNQLGEITDNKLFVCDQPEGYFPVEMIEGITVADECRKIAEESGCNSLRDIHYEDIRYDEMLSGDDIECLMDTYFLYSDEILRAFRRDGLIPDNLWQSYELEYLSVGGISEVNQYYDFPEDPVLNLSQLRSSVRKQLVNPVKVISKEVPRKVLFGKRDNGAEFELGSDYSRQTALQTYNPNPHEDICFCQSCKTAKSTALIEVNNIELRPKFYFPQLRIALCLECSKRFELFRNNDKKRNDFLDRVKKASTIGTGSVEVPLFDDYSITFTAKHLAEIQEILNSDLYES